MSAVTPCLWFDDRIEEAVRFYVDTFGGASAVGDMLRYPDGRVLTIEFKLRGQDFMALNGGPHFKFNEAVSFTVDCADQAEVDYFWEALTAEGGEESMCGWLKDRYGLSWQIVPRRLMQLHKDPDPARAARAMAAMMQMRKIIVADLERAADAA
ncbi:MAG: VOC family protein [Hyphomonadaceae bacterium]